MKNPFAKPQPKSDTEITKLKEKIAELEARNKKLTEVDELKSIFISTVSHQFRTPLSAVKWVLSVLQSDPDIAKMENQKKMVDQAFEGVERVIEVVNDLVNASRIQNGHIAFQPREAADAKKVIGEVTTAAKNVADSRELKYEVVIDPEIPNFNFDPVLLREAIQNLLNNAIDYCEDKGIVSVNAHKTDKNLEVVIKNSGPGIKEEDREKIFEQFYRSPEAVIQHPDGSGLGLYLTRAITTEHGGSLTFTSNPGKETAFTLTIPLKS